MNQMHYCICIDSQAAWLMDFTFRCTIRKFAKFLSSLRFDQTRQNVLRHDIEFVYAIFRDLQSVQLQLGRLAARPSYSVQPGGSRRAMVGTGRAALGLTVGRPARRCWIRIV